MMSRKIINEVLFCAILFFCFSFSHSLGAQELKQSAEQKVSTALYTLTTEKVPVNKILHELFNQVKIVEKRFNVDRELWEGMHPEKIKVLSVEELEYCGSDFKKLYVLIEEIPSASLPIQDQISKQTMLLKLRENITQIEHKMYLIPFNAEGGFYNSPAFFIKNLPFETEADFKNYLKWLPSFGETLLHQITLMKEGLKRNVLPPKLIVENNMELIKPWMNLALESNLFYQPLVNSNVTIDKVIRTSIKEIIANGIIPSYQKFYDFLKNEYLPNCPSKPGIKFIAGGEEYYTKRVAHFTTLDMSPDEVYAIGLTEVARIKSKMDSIIKTLEFKGNFADFLNFLRTDPQFFATTPRALLSEAAWIAKRAEGELPKLFSDLYALPFTVAPVPAAIAPNYTSGRYVPGSRILNMPGIYWVNTYDLASRTLYTLPALTLHEAVPGHHLQITKAAELVDLPEFRKEYYISAFGEGWTLYAEYLGEEMGIYETPFELFGRYTYLKIR